MSFDLPTILAMIGPALGVWVAVKSDIAAMKVQIANLERIVYATPQPAPKG